MSEGKGVTAGWGLKEAFDIIRNVEPGFDIKPPIFGAGPYIMLPGITYTWRVRTSKATQGIGKGDKSWSAWSEDRTFITPSRDSSKIFPISPGDNEVVSTNVPLLQWSNQDADSFYYEIQVSGDSYFNTDPATATSFVWWN